MQLITKNDLLDDRLFGNEAGDDEDQKVLASYFVEKNSFKKPESNNIKLHICMAKKGIGKSALLNYISFKKNSSKENIVLKLNGNKLYLDKVKNIVDPKEFCTEWIDLIKRSANEVYRRSVPSIQTGIRLDDIFDVSSRNLIWIIIDDIDATYIKSRYNDLSLAGFFSALRVMMGDCNNLRIRVSIRQDVWYSVRAADEALDKVKQYLGDIHWSRSETREIISKRIKHYLAMKKTLLINNMELDDIVDELDVNAKAEFFNKSNEEIISYILPETYPWSTYHMKSTDVIHVLSAGRPRWALQLLKMSAEKTVEQKDTIIKWGYVKQILPKYCQYRINDLVKEHQHQTEDLENIIMSFSKSRSEFDTSGLLDYIGRNISLKKPVKIENETEISSPMQIAHFLYRIGFIEAINVDNLSEHYSYSEYSHLLMSTNHDYTKIKWQIRPSYYSGLLP